MAHRLFPLVAAVLLLALGQRSEGQTPVIPAPASKFEAKASDSPPIKERSKQEFDAWIEKAFGPNCEESKRPIRIWNWELDLIVTAKEAIVAKDGRSIELVSPSIALSRPETRILRGDKATIEVENGVIGLKDLGRQKFSVITLHDKTAITILTPVAPAPIANTPIGFVPSREIKFRFKLEIDPEISLTELVPAPAKAPIRFPHWTNEDLAKVPELMFGEPVSKELLKHDAMEKTAHVMAKINHLNAKKRDGFMLAMLEQRPDLRGLPFLMGDECRTRDEQAKVFAAVAELFSRAVAQAKVNNGNFDQVWTSAMATLMSTQAQSEKVQLDRFHRAMVAASMQIFMPESEGFRLNLAKNLSMIPHIDATKALAKLAIYSPEESVRATAIEGLKTRRERDYTDVLVQAFRYPLPAVSKRAAEAMVKLERKDLLANLVEVLESPDPRLPVTEKRDGKDVTFVRELVKVNHHRNCLLCHAPGNTDNTPEGVLKVAVPLPSEPLPRPSEGGGYQSTPPPTPDIVVRLDMTYLRQDFSVMMPVSDAHPWPEMQRFDFLVRARTLTSAEAQAYEECCEVPEPGRLSPYHRSALYALRELTGRDTEPTAAAWRKLLKLAK